MCKEPACRLLRSDPGHWEQLLAAQADLLLETRPGTVFPTLAAAFEAILIERALIAGQGCRQRAADLLGNGLDSITLRPVEQGQGAGDDESGQAFTPLGLKSFFRRGAGK